MDIIHEADIRKTLEQKEEAFEFLENAPVKRSFVNRRKLTPCAANILRKVLIEGSVPRDLNNATSTCYEIPIYDMQFCQWFRSSYPLTTYNPRIKPEPSTA